MSASRRLLAMVGVALVIGTVAVPVASAQSASETSFVVDLHEDGDANVTLQLTFDLENSQERQSLEQLRANDTEWASTYQERLGAVADRTAASTGREMEVTDPSVQITTQDDTGIVELSATWTNLAAVDGERLVVSEPFGEAFTAPGTVELHAPEGYTIVDSTVEANSTAESVATWNSGTSLDGLEVEMAPAGGESATSLSAPGFGPVTAGLGVGILAVLAHISMRRS